jgi:hypothetical protein
MSRPAQAQLDSVTLAGYVCCNETLVLVLSADTHHPGPLSRVRGEGDDLEQDWNPGFRWRSTMGYKYCAPNGAGTRHSAVLTPGS